MCVCVCVCVCVCIYIYIYISTVRENWWRDAEFLIFFRNHKPPSTNVLSVEGLVGWVSSLNPKP